MSQIGTGGCLLSGAPMPSGEYCGLSCFLAADWQDVDIIMPASHHEKQEMRFTAALPMEAERAVSLILPLNSDPIDGSLALVERHGYRVVAGSPYVQLTENHYTLSRYKDIKVWRK